eukprot:GHVT01104852.1.p1 GENE.GHVT01104852.1~~GHVT01104852.1.p1  ORF type:complete len:692 (-),score=34.16 GHVT01104852.1:1264-3339(-)
MRWPMGPHPSQPSDSPPRPSNYNQDVDCARGQALPATDGWLPAGSVPSLGNTATSRGRQEQDSNVQSVSAASSAALTSEVNTKKEGRRASTNTEWLTPAAYNFCSVLGEGSLGRVYHALRHDTQEEVAIKVVKKSRILRSPEAKSHVFAERAILKRLRHPSIVRLLCTFQDDAHLYYVLEMAGWRTLSEHIVRWGGRLRLDVGRFYAGEIVAILIYLRRECVAHRDLKPQNFVVTANGHLKLIDLSSAQHIAPALHESLNTIGSAQYPPAPFPSPPVSRSQPLIRDSQAAGSNTGDVGTPTLLTAPPGVRWDPSALSANEFPSTPSTTQNETSTESSIGSHPTSVVGRCSSYQRHVRGPETMSPVLPRSSISGGVSDRYLGTSVTSDISHQTSVGTPMYMPPEGFVDGATVNGFAADLWALGCIVYEMLVGNRPNYLLSDAVLSSSTLSEDVGGPIIGCPNKFITPLDFPADARDFIKNLTNPCPETRLGFHSINDLLQHAFLRGLDVLNLHNHTPPPVTPFTQCAVQPHMAKIEPSLGQTQEQQMLREPASLSIRELCEESTTSMPYADSFPCPTHSSGNRPIYISPNSIGPMSSQSIQSNAEQAVSRWCDGPLVDNNTIDTLEFTPNLGECFSAIRSSVTAGEADNRSVRNDRESGRNDGNLRVEGVNIDSRHFGVDSTYCACSSSLLP